MTNETFIIRNKDGKWEFDTTNSKSIDFKTLVSETIPQGKENAIELLNISVMLETPPKIVKQAILELIMCGEPICTNDYGLYWKSEIPQEIKETIRYMQGEIKRYQAMLTGLKAVADKKYKLF